MLITGTTFNGANVIALPCDVVPRVTAPSSIEWDDHEAVSASVSPFDASTQTYDWMQSWWEGQVSFPPMDRWSHDAWKAFLRACRGPLNVFMLGDPKAKRPKGAAAFKAGTPVVNGSGQTGYTLSTRGWTASIKSMLQFHDYIQIGNRLYSVMDVVDVASDGTATLPIWPPLRDLPADGAAIITHNCRGMFRLVNNSGNKDSVNVGNYGLSGFAIREAI
ncbi:hypothetical protein [Occallatibacter riparius]|uniref:Uncharacterized protein n=1 Tax=Occallatibacter riparius TaxID=1002689 RepID=A0A9J7BPH6_9BACT|nr:hypothetical protein [Occallatibacter riparius]UWZ84659.1 hypothetical protein MOP44_01690 [Occallatibacter riparius]